jgi:hypothetical protein
MCIHNASHCTVVACTMCLHCVIAFGPLPKGTQPDGPDAPGPISVSSLALPWCHWTVCYQPADPTHGLCAVTHCQGHRAQNAHHTGKSYPPMHEPCPWAHQCQFPGVALVSLGSESSALWSHPWTLHCGHTVRDTELKMHTIQASRTPLCMNLAPRPISVISLV